MGCLWETNLNNDFPLEEKNSDFNQPNKSWLKQGFSTLESECQETELPLRI